eukprot:SM000107S14038  [mRNA]  locus=s107:168703:169215:+ [translate_table: standard]
MRTRPSIRYWRNDVHSLRCWDDGPESLHLLTMQSWAILRRRGEHMHALQSRNVLGWLRRDRMHPMPCWNGNN